MRTALLRSLRYSALVNRYSGQMSSVPPARSIRVGAFDSILTIDLLPISR